MKKILLLSLFSFTFHGIAQEVTSFQHLSSDAIPNYTVDLNNGDIFNRGAIEPQPSIFMPFFSNSTIVALSTGSIGSIAFELTGPLSFSSTDNSAPYALFENTEDTFEQRRFPEGHYTITATPYSEADGQGTAGEPFSIDFTVLDYEWVVYSGRIIDAATDEQLLFYNFQTFQPDLGDDWGKEINFEAYPAEGTPEYMHFILEGPDGVLEVDDYTAPYTVFGDDGGTDYFGRILTPGEYILTAIPYDSNNDFRPSTVFFALEFTVPAMERTFVPDDNFEQALIDLGYDDVLDDYVLTANIDTISDLDISGNDIVDLTGIEDFIGLENLRCSANRISTLDIDSLSSLKILECGANPLETLNVSNNILLEEIVIGLTFIEEIDLSQNVGLKIFSSTQDLIGSYDLSNNILLERLFIGGQQTTDLNISGVNQIAYLGIYDSDISSLDISHLTKLESFRSTNNSQLLCIGVANVENALAQPDWLIDDFTAYSLDCSLTNDSDLDGIEDSMDLCPNTPTNQPVNATGCAVSQLADLAVQNIGLRLGSYCSEDIGAYVEISVKKNVPLNIAMLRNRQYYYRGSVDMENPAVLFELTEADYEMCVSSDLLEFGQCFDISYSEAANSVATTIVIQNPGQTYTMTIGGSTQYEVVVNGTNYPYSFEDTSEQEIAIPLEVGINDISITGLLNCESTTDNDDATVDEQNADRLLLFPTVTSGSITIDNNQRHRIASVSVTGMGGNRVALKPIHDNPSQIELDISGQSEGMYIVQIAKMSGETELVKILLDK